MEAEKLKKNITKAVNWWVQSTSNLKVKTGSGSADLLVLYSKALAKRGIDLDTVKKFQLELTSYLKEQFFERKEREVILSTDYGPEWPLSKIIHQSKIDSRLFPPKTIMWVSEESVHVACGCQAEAIAL